MKKQRFDKDGVPIIDEPLLSPKRIIGGIILWAYLDNAGAIFKTKTDRANVSLWDFIVYHRRPYASARKKIY